MAAAKTTADKVIEIPKITLQKMTVTIVGVTGLITHKFGDRAMGKIEDKQQKKAKVGKEARDPEADFKDALYVIDEKKQIYGFPATGVKKCLVNAGGRFADEQMTVLRGVINILGDLLEIKAAPPVMRKDKVRLSTGVADISYRPMFFPWEIEVPVVFNATMIRDSQVLNLFQIAGFAIGLGDWRPEKNGTFGQFVIKEGGVRIG